MWFFALLAIAIVLVIYLFTRNQQTSPLTRTTSAPTSSIFHVHGKDIWLPTDHYYAWMMIDTELSTNAVVDACVPLPCFRTLREGAVQLVEKYSHDLQTPIGSKHPAAYKDGMVAVGPLIEAALVDIFEKKKVEIYKVRTVSDDTVQVALLVEDDLHDFWFTFRQLPAALAQPRRAVHNVGFFSAQAVVKGEELDIIQCYKRQVVHWRMTPEVPQEWYEPMQRAVDYWNQHLQTAGPQSTRLDLNLEPWTGPLTNPDVNLLCLSSSKDYIGVGTTVNDGRSGEHLWSRIAISPHSINRHSQLFGDQERTTAHRDHLLFYTLTHELGHTLGLRHNFVASVDGNSSYMAYFPSWYPDETGKLHFLKAKISGTYDAMAIQYGYSKVPHGTEETLDRVHPVLQQLIDERQQLFHTDENIDSDKILARVHRHSMGSNLDGPRLWMKSWKRYRSTLFKDPQEHLRDVKRVFFFLNAITESVANSMTFVHGYDTDYRRQQLTVNDQTDRVIGEAVEYLVGDSWRLDDIQEHLLSVTLNDDAAEVTDRPRKGLYTLNQAPVDLLHLNAVLKVAQEIFAPERIATLNDPGRLLILLLTTKGLQTRTSIVGGGDSLHVNTMTGILAAIEHYKDKYSTVAKLSLEGAVNQLMDASSVEHRERITAGIQRVKEKVRTLKPRRPHSGCRS